MPIGQATTMSKATQDLRGSHEGHHLGGRWDAGARKTPGPKYF